MITLLILLCLLISVFASAQLTPGQVLIVKPDGEHFELSSQYLSPADTSHSNLKIMTRWVADSSIAVLNTTIAGKLATAAFTAAAISALYGYTPANPSSIPTNNNQLTNGSAYLVAADITGKLNKSDTAAMLSPYLRSNIAAATYQASGSYVPTSRTISTTSPITGGGDLSANRTFAINNAAADNSTKGAATFDSSYFSASSGLINLTFKNGTGTVSSNAVTINATKGKITYTSPSIIAGTATSITFTNSYVTANSIITANVNSNGTNFATNIQCYVKSQTAGSCVINVANLSLLSLFNSTFLIDFTIIN